MSQNRQNAERPRLTREEILLLKRLANVKSQSVKVWAVFVVFVFPLIPFTFFAVFLFPKRYWLKMWLVQLLWLFMIIIIGFTIFSMLPSIDRTSPFFNSKLF